MSWSLQLGRLRFTSVLCVSAITACAQNLLVPWPASTITHSGAVNNNAESPDAGPMTFTTGAIGCLVPSTDLSGAIKCPQIR